MDFGSEGFGGSLFPESSDTLLMDSDAVSDSPPILETCNPLVSYFAVCGLDPEAIELAEDKPPLECGYRACCLVHRPPSRPNQDFNPDAVCTLALPNGVSVSRESDNKFSPSFHSFVITQENGQQVYGVSLQVQEVLRDSQIINSITQLQDIWYIQHPDTGRRRWRAGQEDLLVTKALVLLFDIPFIMFGRQVLEQLVEATHLPGAASVISTHLEIILEKLSLPSPGHTLEYQGPFAKIMCHRGYENDLPLIDFPMSHLFQTFSIDDILTIFKCLVLETKILLVSEHFHLLMMTAEVLVGLMFPLNWHHVYAPIMPPNQRDLLDAPVPFIMGLQCAGEQVSRDILDLQDDVCLVDIDSGTVDAAANLEVILPYCDSLRESIAAQMAAHNVKRVLSPLDQSGAACTERAQRFVSTTPGLKSKLTNYKLFDLSPKESAINERTDSPTTRRRSKSGKCFRMARRKV